MWVAFVERETFVYCVSSSETFMTRFFLRILLRLKVLNYLNITVKINGLRIPILGGIGLSNIDEPEKWMSEIIRLLLPRSKGCFLDVGVNIGQTLLKLKSIDRNFEYLGLEPNPVCVYYAERFIHLNQFPNTKIIPTGVSNVNEVVTLKYYSNDFTDSSASIIDNFRLNVLKEKHVIVLNSDVINFKNKISIVKIDVEGAELKVIEGIYKIISRDRPYIIIEILPVYNVESKDRLYRQNKLLEILLSLNYSIYRIIKNANDSLKEIILISDIGVHSDITHCDYLVIPNELIDGIVTTKR
jgi:FkbM family methyltransferase